MHTEFDGAACIRLPGVGSAVATLTVSAGSIRVRIGAALFAISGDARELLDTDELENAMRGQDKEEVICALLGLGFAHVGTARKSRGEARRQPGVEPAASGLGGS